MSNKEYSKYFEFNNNSLSSNGVTFSFTAEYVTIFVTETSFSIGADGFNSHAFLDSFGVSREELITAIKSMGFVECKERSDQWGDSFERHTAIKD